MVASVQDWRGRAFRVGLGHRLRRTAPFRGMKLLVEVRPALLLV